MEGLLKAAEGTANDRICEICDRTFSNVSNKRKHLKNIHGLEDLATTTEKSSDVTCEQCGKVFTRVSSKRQHVKVHHVLGRTNRTSTVTCSTCDGTFGTLHTYREHLHHVHGVIINCVHHQFDSKEEFMSWKDEVEMNIGVNYTAHSGSNTTRDGLKKIYYCRRSGVKKASGDSCNKRAEKSQGTSKMGFYCTSSMEALVCDDGRVLVTYYTDHHNHDLDFSKTSKLPCSYSEKITLVLSKLTSACQDIADEEVYKAVNDHLQKALAIANTSKIQIKRSRLPVDVATAEEPANKLCTRQEKLYSTKRKRKHKGPTMRKPNAKMRREIGESMANFESDMRILVKSEGNIEYEHNY